MHLSMGGSPVPVPYLQMTLPSGFTDRWAPPFDLFESEGGQYLTNYDYTTLKPAIAKTYWVKSGGNDGGAGTEGAPLASLSVALGKSDVDEIVIDCSGGDYLMRGSLGWNNTQPGRSLSIRVVGPGRAISIAASSTSAPTWAHVSGAIYKTTITAANSSSVIDLANLQSDGFWQRLTAAGSVGAMTAGTYFHDGTDLNVWAYDSRNLVGDLLMSPCSESNNGRIPSASRTTYIDGMDFVGGAPLLYVAAGAVDPLVVTLNCTFQGSRSSGGGARNNYYMEGPGRFYSYRCRSARANRDAFNFTGNANGSPFYFENENSTGTSGTTSVSDNASTSHNNAAGVRLNCHYRGSYGRTVADINDARSIILGCSLGQATATATSNECLTTANTALTWIGGSRFEAGANPQACIIDTSTISYRKMAAPVRAGTPEDTGTLSVWS